MELGFDYGQKAGKEDKDQNKKPNPAGQDAFQNPDKFYRYEYGSRASFCAGFKSGFVGGYQNAFGKKVPVKISGDGTSTATPSIKPKTTTKVSSPGAPTNVSSSPSDAL